MPPVLVTHAEMVTLSPGSAVAGLMVRSVTTNSAGVGTGGVGVGVGVGVGGSTGGVGGGPHTVNASATDSAAHTTGATPASAEVDNIIEPPAATIVSPLDSDTVSGTITIEVEATDDHDAAGSLSVLYGINAAPAIPLTYNSTTGYYEADWDTATVNNGPRTINASATDSADLTTEASVSVKVRNTGDEPPAATIVSPLDSDTVSGTVTIQVEATDVEDAAGSLSVQYTIDAAPSIPLTYNSATGYYEADWDTTTVGDGPYTINASATDSADQTTEASVSVAVDNI